MNNERLFKSLANTKGCVEGVGAGRGERRAGRTELEKGRMAQEGGGRRLLWMGAAKAGSVGRRRGEKKVSQRNSLFIRFSNQGIVVCATDTSSTRPFIQPS